MEKASSPNQPLYDVSYTARIDVCVEEVLYGGSQLENAQTLIAIALEVAARASYEDPIAQDAATAAMYMIAGAYDEGLVPNTPGYAYSRHLLADATDVLGAKAERETIWLQLAKATIIGEEDRSVEFVTTPDESVIVPVTTDGKIVLVKRHAPALGEDITTVLSKAVLDQPSDIAALQALHKLTIPDSEHTVAEETGVVINPWKYIDSETRCFVTELPIDSDDLMERSHRRDEKTDEIILFSEEAFFSEVDEGRITDLRTIVAVQLALAKKEKQLDAPEGTFTGDPSILEALRVPLPIKSSGPVEGDVDSDWFPSAMVGEDKVILAKSDQSQALGVISPESKNPGLVLLIEPFYARGQRVLCLASGSIEDGSDGEQAARKEFREETDFTPADAPLIRLLHPAYVMPLYLRPQSQVWMCEVVGRGVKEGGDEQPFEEGKGVVIPTSEVMWYILNGYITDGSAMAAIFAWRRKFRSEVAHR